MSAEEREPRETKCWRSECRTACYYPDVCSERPATPDAGDASEVEELAEVTGAKVWRTHGPESTDEDSAENDACHYCQAPHPMRCRPGCAGGAE